MLLLDRRKVLGLAAGFLAAPALIRSAAAKQHIAHAGVYYVSIGNSAFTPNFINIPRTAFVQFANYDRHDHSVTEIQRGFTTGTLEPGQYSEIQFLEFGAFTYYCEFHSYMTGTVNVI